MNIYSNAFNFSHYLTSDVDERTGQYLSNVHLATIYPEGPIANNRELKLSFSTLKTTDSGYGIGWTITNTTFDSVTSQLSLMSGESFKTEALPPINSYLNIKDRKLKDLAVKRYNADTLHVLYKDGVVEVLQRPRPTDPFKISNIIFENGEQFLFQYNNMGLLTKVLNQSSDVEVLSIEYSLGRISICDNLRDNGRIARAYFIHINGQLTKVSIPVDKNQNIVNPNTLPGYLFRYQSFRNGLIGISNMSNPMGGEDVISYRENGHAYANNTFIPNVIQIVNRTNGSSNISTRQFTYSTQNFTGFPFSGGFRDSQDNIYLIRNDYAYSTISQIKDNSDNVLKTKEVIFNRFHLKIIEIVEEKGSKVTVKYSYNDVDGILFNDQPANFQLLKNINKTYSNSISSDSREEDTHFVYDDFGNELSRTEYSGIRYEYDYYPVGGIPYVCPAEPEGLFQRFLREERVYPTQGKNHVKVTQHVYLSILNFNKTKNYILPASSISSGDLNSNYAYVEDYSNIALHGRIKNHSISLNKYTTSTQFRYSLSHGCLTENRKIIGYDNSYLTSNRTFSLSNRLETEITGEDSLKLVFNYDINGRILSEVTSPGTPNQASRQYEYHDFSLGNLAALVMSDAQGGKYITRYDGIGRKVSSSILNDDKELLLRRFEYDCLGRLISEVAHDYLNQHRLELKTFYSYDSWGEIERVTQPDGSTLIIAYDPILQIQTEGIEGIHYQRKYLNKFDKVERIHQVDSNGFESVLVNRTFDGVGRCISEIDIDGNYKNHEYDSFDRVVLDKFIPADGTTARIIEIDFIPQSIETIKTTIKVNGIVVGNRKYDGVGRLVSQSRGSSKESKWSYFNDSLKVDSSISPRGIIHNYQYNKHIGTLEEITVSNITSSKFDFDAITGNLVSARNREFSRELEFDYFGYLSKDTLLFDDANRIDSYQYSPAGRQITMNSTFNDEENYSYDEAGRIRNRTIGDFSFSIDYDEFNRVCYIDASSLDDNLTTTVSYNESGRECMRTFECNGKLLQTIDIEYYRNGLISSKKITNGQGGEIIDEKYIYDAYHRLITYVCSGPEHPKDLRGRSIINQQFRYDALNNITAVTNVFTDGTEGVATRLFNGYDPTQLTEIRHTNPKETRILTFDASGNLLSDGHNKYHYDDLERLINVTQSNANISLFQYDAEGRQIKQSTNRDSVSFHYSHNQIIGASHEKKVSRFIRQDESVLARITNTSGVEFYISDSAASIRGVLGLSQDVSQTHYSPYGISIIDPNTLDKSLLNGSIPGFNGEKLDPINHLYHLGNGRRVYSPELMIFLSPDPLSPFSLAGINSYSYCSGDPINFKDPSGLAQRPGWLAWLLIGLGAVLTAVTFGTALKGVLAAGATLAGVLGVTSGGLGIVSSTLAITGAAIAEVDASTGWDRSSTIDNLSAASLTFGVLSFIAGLGSVGATTRAAYLKASKPKLLMAAGTGEDQVRIYGIIPKSYAIQKSLLKGSMELINYDHSKNLFARATGTVVGVASLIDSIYNIASTSHGVTTNSNSYAITQGDDDLNNLFSSIASTTKGILASAHDYYEKFDEVNIRIRSSAIKDAYDK
nr:hypothetical protein 28Fp_00058 [Serratia proteamaculans]